MKLHSPQFERALRRGTKRAIKASPALKKEFRRANKLRRQYRGYLLVRPMISFFLGFLVWKVASLSGRAGSGLAVISAWTFVTVFIHANALCARLFNSTDLAALVALPITPNDIFRWEFQKFKRASLLALVDMLAAFGTLAGVLDFSVAAWCGVMVVAILTWLFTLSLAALCAARLPRKKYAWVPLAIFPIAGMVFIALRVFQWQVVVAAINVAAPYVNLLLPTGWAVSLFQLLLPQPDWVLIVLLVPVAAIICTVRASLSRLRGFYVFQELVRSQPGDMEPGVDETLPRVKPANPQAAPEKPRQLGPTAILEIIQSRRFLAAPQWPGRGKMESFLWRWFTPRERALSEFAFPNGPVIFRPWIKIFRFLAIAVAAGFAIGTADPSAKIWIIAGGIFFTTCMVLNRAGDSGRMFHAVLSSGVRTPMYTNFAIGLLETARMLFKIGAVQIPLALVWSMTCGILIAHLAGFPLADGLACGARAGFILCAARLIFLVLNFSSGTNDTARLGIRNILLLSCILFFGGLFLALTALGFFLPWQLLAWGATTLAILDAYVFFRVYAWFYNMSFFDLTSLPRR